MESDKINCMYDMGERKKKEEKFCESRGRVSMAKARRHCKILYIFVCGNFPNTNGQLIL